MTTFSAATDLSARASPARRLAGCLTLAAAPAFALMGALSASDGASTAHCAFAAGVLPTDAMSLMYLAMSLFHLPPWLNLASTRPTPHR